MLELSNDNHNHVSFAVSYQKFYLPKLDHGCGAIHTLSRQLTDAEKAVKGYQKHGRVQRALKGKE